MQTISVNGVTEYTHPNASGDVAAYQMEQREARLLQPEHSTGVDDVLAAAYESNGLLHCAQLK